MRPLCAARLPLILSVLLVGCSSLRPLKNPPYCPARPATRQAATAQAENPGGPLHAKTLGYESWARSLAPLPHGGVVNTRFSGQPNQQHQGVHSYDDLQDSTIWTGTYLAAEAFHYAVTGDPKAKENARKAVQTLHFFLEITGRPGYLSRFAGPLDKAFLESLQGNTCSESGNPPCYQVTGQDGSTLAWLGDTSRDQYSGWFFGMGIAYRLVDDPDLRAMIRKDVKEVIDALHGWGFKIKGPGGQPTSAGEVLPSMQLSWLLVAADILQDDPQYCQWYEETVKTKLAAALIDNYSGLNRYFQYFGFNLDFLNNYNLILLEPNAERRKAYLDAFRDGAYRFVEGTGNSLYDYIYMAASGVSNTGTLESDRESLTLFQDAPNIMQCVQPPPAPLSRTSVVLYRINRFLNRLFHVKQQVYPQAENPYPLDQHCPVDFIWQQSPYSVCCFESCPQSSDGGSSWPPPASLAGCQNIFTPNLVYPGADYLLAYWMGRYHGFLTPED